MEVNEILQHSVGDVLKSPTLLMQMLRIYSETFLDSKPCSTCEKYHRGYYMRLQKEGIKKQITIKNKVMSKYKIKENTVITFKGEVFTNDNITDEAAKRMLKDTPGLAPNFVDLPVKEKEEEKVTEKKTQDTKK
jgi:hypothetical protein